MTDVRQEIYDALDSVLAIIDTPAKATLSVALDEPSFRMSDFHRTKNFVVAAYDDDAPRKERRCLELFAE